MNGFALKALIAALVAGSLITLTPGEATANHVQCGDTISQDTTLDSDLDCTGPFAGGAVYAILAGPREGDHITLNLNGHSVRLSGRRNGIAGGNMTIENGRIEGSANPLDPFRNPPCDVGIEGSGLTVRRMTIERCVFGMNLFGSDNRIVENEVRDYAASGSFGIGIELRGFGEDYRPDVILHNVISDNVLSNPNSPVTFSGDGVGIFVISNGTLVKRNVAENNNRGIEVLGTSNSIERNTVRRADAIGIILTMSGTTAVRNTIVDDRGPAAGVTGLDIGGTGAALVEQNRVRGFRSDGIDARAPGAILRKNRADFNGDYGIKAVPGVIDGGGNKAKGNGNPLQCLNVFCK